MDGDGGAKRGEGGGTSRNAGGARRWGGKKMWGGEKQVSPKYEFLRVNLARNQIC